MSKEFLFCNQVYPLVPAFLYNAKHMAYFYDSNSECFRVLHDRLSSIFHMKASNVTTGGRQFLDFISKDLLSILKGLMHFRQYSQIFFSYRFKTSTNNF